ncbi:MAG TPA: cytochrome c biogenesis protein CcdA [Acidimicrobiales bacterium]|nr:cytochrome c biogenesis protein CcdA [Acidimicrobiales bacterium]
MQTGHLITSSPLGFVVAFGAGVVSFLSPCVLPLVPSYLSMMSGLSGAQLAAAEGADSRRLVRATLLFVAGFTVVFAAFETGAFSISRPLQAHHRVLDEVAGALIVVMGLVFAGLLRPRWVLAERRWHVAPSRLGAWAAPVMGMAFAVGWTPCIGPALAAVLGLTADAPTLLRGEAMLLAFSLGLGVPFVVAGTAFSRVTGLLVAARAHARALNVVSGVVLAALGVLLFTGEVTTLSTWAGDALRAVGLGRLSQV